MRVLLILLVISYSLCSQNKIDSFQQKRIKILKPRVKKNNNSVYIKSKLNDNNDLIIFLINESSDTLKIKTESSNKYYINFQKEIRDNFGNWKTETPNLYCITLEDTSYPIKIPPNFYTWEKIEQNNYFGNFKTEMRVSLQINKEKTITEKFEISYNPNLFLSKKEQSLIFYNEQISDSINLSKKDRSFFQVKKSELYLKMNKFKKSYIYCDSIINSNFNNDRIQLNKARSLFRYILKNYDTLTEIEKIAYLSKNLKLIKSIHSTNEKIKKNIKSYSKSLNSHLLSKKEFDNKFPNKIDDYCFEINFIKKEMVEILFKE